MALGPHRVCFQTAFVVLEGRGHRRIDTAQQEVVSGSAEMRRKYDAILDFSELADFIDVPVKHYSSGMFARLAFAVSIHLDPEVLLVDEVLAVGDQAFQRKCLDRISRLQAEGVTICIVSHSSTVFAMYP